MGLLGGKGAIILALIFGLIAAAVAYNYMQEQGKKPPPPIEMAQVVVAAQNIPSRTTLAGAMLEEKQIPLSARHPAAVTSVAQAVGKLTRYPIVSGEQVLPSKFSAER